MRMDSRRRDPEVDWHAVRDAARSRPEDDGADARDLSAAPWHTRASPAHPAGAFSATPIHPDRPRRAAEQTSLGRLAPRP